MMSRNRRLFNWILMFQESKNATITEVRFGLDASSKFKGFLKSVGSELVVSKLYSSTENGLILVGSNNKSYEITLSEIMRLI